MSKSNLELDVASMSSGYVSGQRTDKRLSGSSPSGSPKRQKALSFLSIDDPLRKAADLGHGQDVAAVLRAGVDIKYALHTASKLGLSHLVSALVVLGLEVTLADSHGLQPLCVAAAAGHHSCVISLVAAKADPDTVCSDAPKSFPLLVGARQGHLLTVNWLLAAGASPNKSDSHDSTALHEACGRGHEEVALVLVTAGASITALDDQCRMPMHRAAGFGREDLVKSLISAGAPIDAQVLFLNL